MPIYELRKWGKLDVGEKLSFKLNYILKYKMHEKFACFFLFVVSFYFPNIYYVRKVL